MVLTLALVWLLACEAPPEVEPIRIGHLLESEGSGGIPARESVRLLIQQINDAGGVPVGEELYPVELHEALTRSTPEGASAAALELINQQRVHALVGPYRSNTAIPAGGVAEGAEVVMLSPSSTHPQTTADRRFVFRAVSVDTTQAIALARFAKTQLEARRVAVLYDETHDYNRGMAQGFLEAATALGLTVAAEETYIPGALRFEPALERIAAARADVLLLPNFNDDVTRQVRQARRLGLSASLLGGDAWNPEEMNLGAELDGTYFCHAWDPKSAGEAAASFVATYEHQVGYPPTDLTALAWDSTQVLLAAITRAGSLESPAIRHALANLTYQGVTGELVFRQSNDPSRPVLLFTVRDGQTELAATIEPAESSEVFREP